MVGFRGQQAALSLRRTLAAQFAAVDRLFEAVTQPNFWGNGLGSCSGDDLLPHAVIQIDRGVGTCHGDSSDTNDVLLVSSLAASRQPRMVAAFISATSRYAATS